MKNHKVYSLLLISLFMLATMIILGSAYMAQPASGETWIGGGQKEVDIETGPTEYLFNLSNMKPGDSAVRWLKITNNGKRNFSYSTKINYKSGSKEFLNALNLIIKDSRGVKLYTGPLLNLSSDCFAMRYLPVKAEDTLEFSIEFVDSGKAQNDLQNKAANFELSLNAEEYINRDLGFKKITGGGTIDNKNSKKDNGKSFGFNVIPNNEGLSVNLQYTDHDSQTVKDIHVNDYAYNVNPIINNKNVVGIEFDVMGECDKKTVRLHVKTIDFGEPGTNDKFLLEIIEGPNKGYVSGNETITDGNIQIHK